MELQPSKFAAARHAAQLTQEQAAEIMNVKCDQTYRDREKDPNMFRLSDLKLLSDSMNEAGRTILRDAVNDIFLPQ